MPAIQFQIVQPGDSQIIETIAEWYTAEWKIPAHKTLQKLQFITNDNSQLQVVMLIDNVPVSTGGLYNHIGLLEREPRLGMYKNWLALVYTVPDKRQQGFGSLICEHIEQHSKNLGLEKIHLFTDTAERLYKRLGWIELERLSIGDRKIVVMEKELLHDTEQQ